MRAFLMNEAQLSQYTVMTRMKVALRSEPDLIVVYAQEGEMGKEKKLVVNAGVELFVTNKKLCQGLREAMVLKNVSPARFSYYMKLIDKDTNAEMPQCNRGLMQGASAQKRIFFAPGNTVTVK
jgi:hypothetical protein